MLVLATALALVYALFNPDDYRDDIAAYVAARTGRAVSIQGPVRMSFYPWLGLHLKGVRIEGAPGDDTPLLQAASVAARVRLWPLLSRKIIMDRVFLRSPQLFLQYNTNGTANWDGLRWGDDAPATPSPTVQAAETEWFTVDAITLNSLIVRNGAVVLDDKEDDVFLSFTGIELEASPGPHFPFTLSFAFRNADPPIAADATFQGTGHLSLSPFAFHFDDTRMDLRGTLPFLGSIMPCRLHGTAMFNPVDETMSLDNAVFSFHDLDMGTTGTLQGTLSGSGAGERLFQRAMAYHGTAQLSQGGLTRTPPPHLVAAADAESSTRSGLSAVDTLLATLGGSARFAVDIDDLRLDKVEATAPEVLAAPVTGNAAVLDFSAPVLHVTAATPFLDCDLLAPPQPDAATAPGSPLAWLMPQEVEGWLDTLDVNATLSVARATGRTFTAKDARVRLGHRANGGGHHLEADLSAQTLTRAGTPVVDDLSLILWRDTPQADAFFRTPLLQVRGNATRCDLGPMLPPAAALAPSAPTAPSANARPETVLLPPWLHPDGIRAALGGLAVNATLAAAQVASPALSLEKTRLDLLHQGQGETGILAIDAHAASPATAKGAFADTVLFTLRQDTRPGSGPTRMEAEVQAQTGRVAATASLRWRDDGATDAKAKCALRRANVARLARTAPFTLPPGWLRHATGRATGDISLAASGATMAELAPHLSLQANLALAELDVPVRDLTGNATAASPAATTPDPALFAFTNAAVHVALRGAPPSGPSQGKDAARPALSTGAALPVPYAALCTLSLSRPDAQLSSGPSAGQDVPPPSLAVSLQGQTTIDAVGLSLLNVDKGIARLRYQGPSSLLGIAANTLQGPRALPMDIEIQTHPTYAAAEGTLDLDDTTLRAFGALARGSARLTGLPGTPNVQASIAVPSFVPRAVLRAMGVSLPDMAAASALQQGAFHAMIDMDATSLRINDILLDVDRSKFRGSVAMRDFAAPAWTVRMSGTSLNADNYLPPKTSPTGAGSMPWPSQLAVGPDGRPLAQPWDIEPLRNLRLTGRLQLDKLTLFHLDYENVDATVAARDGDIAVRPLNASHYDGAVSGEIHLFADKTLACRSSLHAAGFQVEPSMRHFFDSEDLVGGTGDVAWTLASQGLSWGEHAASLSGDASLTITDGYYKVFGKGGPTSSSAPQTSAQTGGDADEQAAPQNSPRTQFRSATGTFTLRNGTITNDDFDLQGLLVAAKGSGNASLVSKEFDYTLLMQMTGLPTFPIRFHGTFSDPHVTMRGGQIITDTVGRVGTSVFDLIKGVITTPFKLMERVIQLPDGEPQSPAP